MVDFHNQNGVSWKKYIDWWIRITKSGLCLCVHNNVLPLTEIRLIIRFVNIITPPSPYDKSQKITLNHSFYVYK